MQKTSNSDLNRISKQDFSTAEKIPVVLILDNVRSLNNVGSIFRTADAFAIEEIYLCGITGTPPHRDMEKTALGATETVQWKYFENTIDAIHALKKSNYKIIAIEQATESILLQNASIKGGEKHAFIFGNEVNGVSEDVMKNIDECLEIPQFGTKHSFNISVSAGIVLWHFYLLFHRMK